MQGGLGGLSQVKKLQFGSRGDVNYVPVHFGGGDIVKVWKGQQAVGEKVATRAARGRMLVTTIWLTVTLSSLLWGLKGRGSPLVTICKLPMRSCWNENLSAAHIRQPVFCARARRRDRPKQPLLPAAFSPCRLWAASGTPYSAMPFMNCALMSSGLVRNHCCNDFIISCTWPCFCSAKFVSMVTVRFPP